MRGAAGELVPARAGLGDDRCAAISGLGPDGYAINVTSGSPRPATTSATSARPPSPGTKYEDDNADGNQDAGDDPLSGWAIRAYSDTNGDGTLQPARPRSPTPTPPPRTGAYDLQLDPGQYVVCEVLQSGWPSASPSRPTTVRRDRGPRRRTATRSRDLGFVRNRQRLRQLPGAAPSRPSSTKTTTPTATRTPARTALGLGDLRLLRHQRRRRPRGRRDHDRRLRHHHGDRRLRASARPGQVRRLRGPAERVDTARAGLRATTLRGDLRPRRRRLRDRRHLGLLGDRQRLRQLPRRHQVGHQVRGRQRRRQPGRRRGPALRLGHPCLPRTPTATAPPGRRDHDRHSDTTTATGAYELQLDPGKYVVCEVLQTGWTQREPVSGTTAAPPSPASAPDGYAIDVTSGFTETGNDFGNYRQLATKTGTKYEDDNGDGNQDAGEDPLSGWVIRAYLRHQRRRHPPGRRDHDRRLRHHHRRPARISCSSTPASTSSAKCRPSGWTRDEPVSDRQPLRRHLRLGRRRLRDRRHLRLLGDRQ